MECIGKFVIYLDWIGLTYSQLSEKNLLLHRVQHIRYDEEEMKRNSVCIFRSPLHVCYNNEDRQSDIITSNDLQWVYILSTSLICARLTLSNRLTRLRVFASGKSWRKCSIGTPRHLESKNTLCYMHSVTLFVDQTRVLLLACPKSPEILTISYAD